MAFDTSQFKGAISLDSAFKIPNDKKTLKLEINGSQTDTNNLYQAINSAYNYVRSANPTDTTKIEFKFDNCYFIVARLK